MSRIRSISRFVRRANHATCGSPFNFQLSSVRPRSLSSYKFLRRTNCDVLFCGKNDPYSPRQAHLQNRGRMPMPTTHSMDDIQGWHANWCAEEQNTAMNMNAQQGQHGQPCNLGPSNLANLPSNLANLANFNPQYAQPSGIDNSLNMLGGWNPAGSRVSPSHEPGTSASGNNRRRKAPSPAPVNEDWNWEMDMKHISRNEVPQRCAQVL